MDEYELRLRDKIEQVAAKYPRYGYRRTSEMLKRDGYKVGYRRVARIMKEENLQVHVKRYCRTTHSTGGVVRYPNLLKDSEIEHSDQFWCGDITYVGPPTAGEYRHHVEEGVHIPGSFDGYIQSQYKGLAFVQKPE